MSANFCPYCGSAMRWRPAGDAVQNTPQQCSGCGSELYRNPDVCVLCLVHDSEVRSVSVIAGPIAEFETIQQTGTRLLADSPLPAAVDESQLRLVGILSDLDHDCVYIVFGVQVAPDTAGLTEVG